MAKPQRVTYFKIGLENKPGALLKVARDLKSKNVGLIGLMGQEAATGQGEVYLIAKVPEKLRTLCTSSGWNAEEGTGFLVKGSDRTGALVKTLESLAKAGVNITMSEAMAAGGSYDFFIRVSPADLDKTAQALGAA